MSDFVPGLEGVVAFETEIAEPDKEGGALRYRGVDIEELVGHVSFGNVWGLLVDGAFVGAVGASGGSAAQDKEVAAAGAAAVVAASTAAADTDRSPRERDPR